jgi:hypothetical protein
MKEWLQTLWYMALATVSGWILVLMLAVVVIPVGFLVGWLIEETRHWFLTLH